MFYIKHGSNNFTVIDCYLSDGSEANDRMSEIIEEIKSIDPSFYERIKVLLDSIKNGTFKNVKRFVSNSKLKGFAEVKEYFVSGQTLSRYTRGL